MTERHGALGARLVEFAGWQMPVWYTGASEEHAAVRAAAGLFDIGHMAVLEITDGAQIEFFDAVSTARTGRVEVGRCRYTFLLDPAGLPIDDVILYHTAADRFLMVVNAANAARVWEWLSGHAPEHDVTLRDLSDASAEGDRVTGMALQGPASAEILARLAEIDLNAMPRFGLERTDLLGAPAIVSRTGYTGEPLGCEVFVHPNEAPRVWEAMLEAGATPAGLAARDSLRIEAGLPLYGHELAGRHEITPMGAGYGRFVELEKDAFIGKEALLQREERRECEVARFRLDGDGARAIREGDIVGSRRGQMVGWVTSCAPVGDTQMGMAWIDRKLTDEGAELLLYPARHLERAADLSDAEALGRGDRLPIHEPGTVLPRHP
jgi:glycine hydroxymethyltransferase